MYSPGIPVSEYVRRRPRIDGSQRVHILETVIVQSRRRFLLLESLEDRLTIVPRIKSSKLEEGKAQ